MLISLDYKFIFVANLKTASTAIETALRPFADIALIESRFEKHAPLFEIERRFSWVFELIPRNEFFVFGVMRDPAEYVVSIFNSHTDDKFADHPSLYTQAMSFAEFRMKWAAANPAQLRPQYSRFLSRDGSLGVDYLISLDRLDEGFRFVCNRLGLAASIERLNPSNPRLQKHALTSADVKWVQEQFEQDYYLLDGFCGRVLSATERVNAAGALTAHGRPLHYLDPSNARQLSSGWEELIHALYRVLLLREPDLEGVEAHLRSLRDGADFERLIRGFLRSDEFARTYLRFLNAHIEAASPALHTAQS
jgi:hypothetical protein